MLDKGSLIKGSLKADQLDKALSPRASWGLGASTIAHVKWNRHSNDWWIVMVLMDNDARG